MTEKGKSIAKYILIGAILLLASLAPKLNLAYKEYKMNQMLIEHGVISPDGQKLPPYSGQ